MSIGRGAIYNLVGFVVPTVIGLVTVPAYIHLIGQERYGVLALGWLILGYFGVFDLGLGRATAQRIAALRDAPAQDRRRVLATSLVANAAMGALGAALLLPVMVYLFGQTFSMSAPLRDEALAAAPLIALALPLATGIGVLSGALMGREQFYQVNRIAVTSTLILQLVPLGVAWLLGAKLVWLMAASILARLTSAALLWRACCRAFGRPRLADWDRAQIRPLLSFGGWVVLTGLFGPLLVFSDRLLIGTLISAAAVTVYTVPMDAMMRIAGFSTAITNALFPRLAIADAQEAEGISRLGISVLYALLTPIVAGALFVMFPLMRLWLGPRLGQEAAPLAMIFLVAMWFNAFAQIPYARLQAQGRPDLVSKLLMAEMPFYLAALWAALTYGGLTGAALVFLARIVVDTAGLFTLCYRGALNMAPVGATLLVLIGVIAARWHPEGEPLSTALIWAAAANATALVSAAVFAPEGLRRIAAAARFRIGRP